MNYTFAREILQKCRAVSGIGSIRVWKAEFDGVLQAWREQRDSDDNQSADSCYIDDRGADKAFADAWRNYAKAE